MKNFFAVVVLLAMMVGSAFANQADSLSPAGEKVDNLSPAAQPPPPPVDPDFRPVPPSSPAPKPAPSYQTRDGLEAAAREVPGLRSRQGELERRIGRLESRLRQVRRAKAAARPRAARPTKKSSAKNDAQEQQLLRELTQARQQRDNLQRRVAFDEELLRNLTRRPATTAKATPPAASAAGKENQMTTLAIPSWLAWVAVAAALIAIGYFFANRMTAPPAPGAPGAPAPAAPPVLPIRPAVPAPRYPGKPVLDNFNKGGNFSANSHIDSNGAASLDESFSGNWGP